MHGAAALAACKPLNEAADRRQGRCWQHYRTAPVAQADSRQLPF
jgi:hypothetical protein